MNSTITTPDVHANSTWSSRLGWRNRGPYEMAYSNGFVMGIVVTSIAYAFAIFLFIMSALKYAKYQKYLQRLDATAETSVALEMARKDTKYHEVSTRVIE